MSALSLQYKGYRLMLEENYLDYLDFERFTRLDDGRIYVACGQHYKPSEAYEACMFAPLGYWKTVHEDPLYPDDYPLDVLQSINSGTATQEEKDGIYIEQNVPDGQYDYYYNFYDVWKRLKVVIKDKKLVELNQFTIAEGSEEIKQGNIGIFAINMDVLNAFVDNIPTTILVAQQDASELPIDLIVKHTVVDKPIPVDLLVTYVSDVPTYINVSHHNDIPTTINVYRRVEDDLPTDILVQQNDTNDLPTEVTVKRYLEDGFPMDMIVCWSVWIPTEVLVQRVDYLDIPTKVNIQRVETSEVPTSVIVKHTIYDTPCPALSFIVVRNKVVDIPTNMYVVANGSYSTGVFKPVELPIEISIDKKEKQTDIPTRLAVLNDDHSDLPIRLLVTEYGISMETIHDMDVGEITKHSEIPTTVTVANYTHTEGLQLDIYVINKVIFEAVADGIVTAVSDLPTTVEIIQTAINEMPINLLVQREANFETIVRQLSVDEYSDLPTTLSVVNNDVNELAVTLVVDRVAVIKTIHNLDYRYYDNETQFPVTLLVGSAYICEDKPIYMNVVAKSTAFETKVGRFAQQGKPSSVKTTLTVVQHVNTEGIPVTMNVIHKPFLLKAITDFTHRVEIDVPTTLHVVYSKKSEIPVTMYVNPLGHLNAVATITNYINNDLFTFVAVPIIENLFDINFYVSTEGIAPVIETRRNLAPRQLATENIKTRKDSYMYNFALTMNYGKKPRLNIANSKNKDIMTSIIGFDLTPLNIDIKDKSADYFDYETIESVTMNLNIESALTHRGVIKVYRVDDKWIETNINYKNVQNLDRYLVTEVPAPMETGRFEIDITDDFMDFENQENTLQRSYLLTMETRGKDNSIVTMSSMQTALGENAKPSLTVKYWHTPPNCDWIDTPTDLEVNPWDEIPVTMYVTDPVIEDYPEITLEVAQTGIDVNMFDLYVWVVQSHTYEDLPTTLEVIGYPCDEEGMKLKVFVNFGHTSLDIDTTLTVVRNPDKEAYVYLL